MDRISNLPDNVIEDIQLRIPLRDAVRTSILSRSWRYKWSTLPQLVFDENSFRFPVCNNEIRERKCVEFVDKVLVAHHGPIHRFKLSTKSNINEDINRWILFLSRNGIKEFILEKWNGEIYKIPSSLFSCEGITHLVLYRCSTVLPASFNGFNSLTTLDLETVNFSENGLQTLISVCPLLEKLALCYIDGCRHLKTYSMKLVDLCILMELEDLNLMSSPLIAVLCIELLTAEDPIVSSGTVCKLVPFFCSIPKIERLELSGRTLRILSRGDVPSELPKAFLLHDITMKLDFEDTQEMLAALSIFRSSPILQTFHIKVHVSSNNPDGNYIEGFWTQQENPNCLFNRLQTVEITDFMGTKSELGFIELVMGSAPILKNVQIKIKEKIDLKVDVYMRMLGFERASSKAKIVF